jgi:hypothetical protein
MNVVAKVQALLCKLGIHDWSRNRGGIRICQACPAIDRYIGLSGLIRFYQETGGKIQKETDTELRAWWLKYSA